MTIEELIKHTADCFSVPRKEFEMRTYLNRKFVEQGTDKVLAKKIEKRLGGNGEQ